MDQPAGPLLSLVAYDVTGLRDSFVRPAERLPHWVLLAPLQGRFRYRISGTDQVVGSDAAGICRIGEIVLCPPDALLERTLLGPSRFWFSAFDLVDRDVQRWWPAGRVAIADRQRLRADLAVLDETARRWDVRRIHVVTHVLTDVLLLIGRENEPAERPIDRLASAAARHLAESLADPGLSIESLAGELAVSPTHLTRRFRAAWGVPPIRYLTELRIARAHRLLLDTDLTVSAIATRCGYRSAFYFSRVFHRATGQSPTRFRATRRV